MDTSWYVEAFFFELALQNMHYFLDKNVTQDVICGTLSVCVFKQTENQTYADVFLWVKY